ncbi:NB-ARC domain-containing protein [Phytohabitans kaempferiae]|uniref:NB-ARC domain-containing protein n=1 Tax=Phytohabitans kaempferiae TaxID=1620943 RepID=A0ABV6MBW1_9ACTN
MFDDPLLAAVASAVAGRAVDGMAEGGKALVRRLRGRAAADPAVAAALDHHDLDGQALIAVRAFLRAAALADPDVAAQLTQLGRLLPPPRQLPPPAAWWVNRADDLTRLRRLCGEVGRRRVVVLLVGAAGVGKTALAVQAAAADDRGQDGHLYIDLRGTGGGGPLPASVALARLLRSVGVPEPRLPHDVDELVTLWRSVTAARRLVVLLDNAHSAQQVQPLLPANPHCLVYVTARTALPALVAAGAHLLPVGPLDDAAATTLLGHVAGPQRLTGDPAAAARLVGACRGVPLAVAVAGAHLAADPGQTARRLADTLTAAVATTDGDTAMTATFAAAYDRLPEPAQRLLTIMTAHPGPDFTPPAAAAGTDLPPADTRAALAALVHTQLLTVDADGRYWYPDPVAAYARAHGPGEPERQQATRRIVQWYLAGTLAAAGQLTGYQRYLADFHPQQGLAVPPDFGGRQAAADWLELERVNLVDAVAAAAAQGWHLLAYGLAYASWPLFHLHRHHHDRQVVDQIATDCARHLHHPTYLAAALTRQAWGCNDRGDHNQATELFTQAQQTADQAGDIYERAGALAGYGTAAIALGRHEQAIAASRAALADYHQLGAPRRAALATVTLGRAYIAAGDLETGTGLLAHAVELFAALPTPDPLNHAHARILWGRALTKAADTHTAAVELTAGLTATRALVWPRGQALALLGLGELARHGNRQQEAIDYLHQAEALFNEAGDTEVTEVRQLLQAIATERAQDQQ